jgi:ABC-type oligopeptide transport system ATPase subunit
MSAETEPTAPELRNTETGRVLKKHIWDRCNIENKHAMAAIVGREGSGKSWTALKIAELVDPDFHAGRVMFDPANFLERLQSDETGPGSVVVLDEAGVGVGNRTWYEKDQILLNQTLQVVRDENMAAIFTLPRLTELDSQTRGRLTAFMEMTDLDPGDHAKLKFKTVDPSRDEQDKLYKKYPRMRIDGRERRITRIALTPPSKPLRERYEERKAEFKEELYQEAISALRGEDDEDTEQSPSEITNEIKESGVDDYVAVHGGNGTRYISWELIREEYDLSRDDAKTVKKLLEADDEVSI